MVVVVCQGLQFFRQITWFLGSNRDLSKFNYCILYYLISIIKLQNNESVKPNLILATRANLKIYSVRVNKSEDKWEYIEVSETATGGVL